MTYRHRCLLPFHHIAIRPNDQVYPCCQFRWKNTPEDLNLNHDDVFNHPFMQQLRDQVINDEYIEGCSMCYQQEQLSNGTDSMRLHFIKNLGTEIPKTPVLTHVDLALSNVCNNKCRMCNPDLSTSWYADAKKLGEEFFPPIKHSGIKKSKDILEQYDLSQLRYLKLIGGEPLMEEAKFINLLKRCDLPKLKVLLTTNTTLIPSDELYALLKQCGSVWVNLSVDAFGELNSFLRKGSKWNNVVKVMDWFNENVGGRTTVHGVISIYNVNNFYLLDEFIKERYGNKINVEWQMVDGPNWMQPANLPQHAKDQILLILREKVSESTFSMIESEFKNTGDIDLFLNKDAKLNEVRVEDWRLVNLDLQKLINPCIENNIQTDV